ncbi:MULTISPECIES: AraC family transcriptional regulator [Nocardia]|uniref:AraC family transcriptional regulator n=1 Tax=Nocardia abscessus TaxID=120957 RepID=UPI00245895AC|nr:AraC family transcriptional regulator [Nocardia abscessus]
MSDISVARSASLRAFRPIINELGGDPERYATRAGLPIRALDEDDLPIPELAVAEALRLAATELGCPDIGLRLAQRTGTGMLGALAMALHNSSTLAGALNAASQYLSVHSRSLRITVVPDPYQATGVVALRYGPPTYDHGTWQANDFGLGCMHRIIATLAGRSYGLRSVELPYPAPAPLSVYENFFEAPVRDRRPAALLRIPHAVLTWPVAGTGDRQVRELALAMLARQLPEERTELAPQVAAVVSRLLGSTAPDLDRVADALHLHRRTLQRRLEREGTSLTAIVDDVRKRVSHRYLTGTTLSLNQIAGLLSLSSQSAFTRCSHRWWGRTPSAVRAAALGVPGVASG